MSTFDAFRTVPVKNRTDQQVVVIYDGKEIVFEPAEVRHLPPAVADHAVRKAVVRMNPLNWNDIVSKLCRLDTEGDLGPLPLDELNRSEVIDRFLLPPTMFDEDGVPLKPMVAQIGNAPLVRVNRPETAEERAEAVRVVEQLDAAHDAAFEVVQRVGLPSDGVPDEVA